jgi:bromodomain-containing protein 7/9
MDVSESSSPIYSQPGSPSTASLSEPSSSKPSGLKLILPPLRGGKPVKVGKKPKQRFGSQPSFGGQDEEKKIVVRPVKLKPLKEVLARLIVQIQKYAFLVTERSC